MSPIGTVRVRHDEDDYVASIYIQIAGNQYRVIHVDTNSGFLLEAGVSDLTAERWPIVWTP